MKKSLEINSYAIEYLSGGVLREVFVNNAVGGREEREETAEGIGLRREDLVSGAAARLGSKRQAPRRRHDGVTTARGAARRTQTLWARSARELQRAPALQGVYGGQLGSRPRVALAAPRRVVGAGLETVKQEFYAAKHKLTA